MSYRGCETGAFDLIVGIDARPPSMVRSRQHEGCCNQAGGGRASIPTMRSNATGFASTGTTYSPNLTSNELVWDDAKGRVDLRDLRPIADDVLLRVNGLGTVVRSNLHAGSITHLTFPNGAMTAGDWTPNRDGTYLGAAGQHDIVNRALPLAQSNPDVKFVLEAMVLPATWASLYLVIDAIKTNIGSKQKLEKLGWLSKADLSDLTYSANNSRNIKEGARHRDEAQSQAVT